ncbi:hypothetical protein BG004_004562 [Podila humilis]|nr:hypothetical protein BG004_004562 [Podila humilis]
MHRGGSALLRTLARPTPSSPSSSSSSPSSVLHLCAFHRRLASLSSATAIGPTPKAKRRPRLPKTKLLTSSSSHAPPATPSLNTVATHLTDKKTPRQARPFFQGPEGELRLARFARLHAALQHPKDLEPMWEAYQEIREFKQDMDSNLSRWDSSDLMSALNKLGRFDESLKEMDRILQTTQGIDPILLNHAVRAWGGLGRLDKAMEAIQEAQKRFEIRPSEFTLGYLIQQFLLQSVIRRGTRRPVQIGGLGGLGGQGGAEAEAGAGGGGGGGGAGGGSDVGDKYRAMAMALWQELQPTTSTQNTTNTTNPMEDIQTANGILRTCLKIHDSQFAQIVYNALPTLQIEPNLETLDIMLRLAVKDLQCSPERYQQQQQQQQLEEEEIIVDDERQQFLGTIDDKVSRRDRPIMDNKRMLDSILSGFSQKGDMEGAMMVHQLMIKHGFPTKVHERNVILKGLLRQNQGDRALDWFQRMRRDGIRPDRTSYLYLLRYFTQNRMPRETEAVFRQLVQDGSSGSSSSSGGGGGGGGVGIPLQQQEDQHQPDLAICNQLLLAYEQARMNRRCLQLYKTMLQDPNIGLDRFSFSCMFNAVFHNNKAIQEGGEGRHGQGAMLGDPRFLAKIGEPIGNSSSAVKVPKKDNRCVTIMEQRDSDIITVDNGSRTILSGSTSTPPSPPAIGHHHHNHHLHHHHQKFQFGHITSTTGDALEARSLFRDMVIAGIRPSQSLYANILRAFLCQQDFAGAAVALRTLLDYYVMKPTPKMNAIVITFVCEELEQQQQQQLQQLQQLQQQEQHQRERQRQYQIDEEEREVAAGDAEVVATMAGLEMRDREITVTTTTTTTTTATLAELSKLVHSLGRTRGLIDILERVAKQQQQQQQQQQQDNEINNGDDGQLPTSDRRMVNDGHYHPHRRYGREKGLADDAFALAKHEMGGDFVDLFARGMPSGSFWTKSGASEGGKEEEEEEAEEEEGVEDAPVHLDLKDFERWFKTYSNRRSKLPSTTLDSR